MNDSHTQEPSEIPWTAVITPKRTTFNIPLGDIWRYRDLIALFAHRDIVATYKQTVLGPVWYFIQPLFTTVVFAIIFGRLAGIPTDGVPDMLFFMSGVILWSYFASCLTKTSTTFTGNSRMFGKVYFPRLTVPISMVLTSLVMFFLQLLLFISFYAYYWLRGADLDPTYRLLVLPVLLVQMAMLGLGCGCIVSSLTTKYRDLSMLVAFGVQLWMYASCIVFPLSEVPDPWRLVLVLGNPMVPVIEAFRFSVFGAGVIEIWQLAVSFVISFVILIIGMAVFSQVEKDCMDVV